MRGSPDISRHWPADVATGGSCRPQRVASNKCKPHSSPLVTIRLYKVDTYIMYMYVLTSFSCNPDPHLGRNWAALSETYMYLGMYMRLHRQSCVAVSETVIHIHMGLR